MPTWRLSTNVEEVLRKLRRTAPDFSAFRKAIHSTSFKLPAGQDTYQGNAATTRWRRIRQRDVPPASAQKPPIAQPPPC